MIQSVSVIGLGKLGACMAAIFAKKKFQTIGVDLDREAVEAINRAVPPVLETKLGELLAESKENLCATTNVSEAIQGSDATFIIVPTPSNKSGAFSLKYLTPVFQEIGEAIAEKSSYHLVVLTSTVLPGSSEHVLLPILEKASGKKCGSEFGLCYSPEFIALGSVIDDFLNPDFVLIGESDPNSGKLLEDFYKIVCENHPPIARMRMVNAELTKMSVNSFMTMKISFANLLSGICYRIPGGDVDVVTDAMSLFGGVGKKGFRAGMGYGGPCLPRDNVALAYLANSVNFETSLLTNFDSFNRSLVGRLWELTSPLLKENGTVLILGASYKANTSVVEESQGFEFASLLASQGIKTRIFDPALKTLPNSASSEHLELRESLDSAVQGARTIILLNADENYSTLAEILNKIDRPVTLIDPWRFFKDKVRSDEFVEYVPLGIGEDQQQLIDRVIKLAE